MKLIRGIHNIQPQHQGSVLSIGNFDGVHLGHQAVLNQVVSKAKKLGLTSCVMLFEPQPREFFSALSEKKAPARLSNFREKYNQLVKLGVEQLLVVKFDEKFATLSPNDFIQILTDKLQVNFLIVGDDFRFGAEQKGDFDYLIDNAPFDVMNTKSFQIETDKHIRVSSTAIREALAMGEFELAKTMLGRDFSISGRVCHGAKLGRTLNFPTANIALKRLNSPLMGVFAVQVSGISAKPIHGVANIGMRPTVNGTKARLEVHLLNFDQNIYGKHLEVRFFKKLRNEQKFDSLSALKQQIEYDALAAFKWLENN